MKTQLDRVDVLVVGQTPPPYHGQAIMIDMLVRGRMESVRIHHVRMAFSDSMDQVGRFQISKLFHLAVVIIKIIWARIRYRPTILYYPPAGPNRTPVLRDIAILLCTRWMFRRTVFHFQAGGISELIPRLPGWLQWLVRRAMWRPDGAVVLSTLTRNDGEMLEAKRIFVIPNAAEDFSHSDPLMRSDRSNRESVRILYVGTVCETKGVLVLLEACRALKNEGREFQVDVVGSFQPAEFEDQVKSVISESGLKDKVTLHGQKIDDAKWRMFSAADIFCFPSHYESEGFPCVLVEAMSFSLPVVTTRWRGIPSIVLEEETGYLIECRDVRGLASRLSELIDSPTLRDRLGSAGRSRYEAFFTRQKHLEQMNQMFVEVAQK